MGVDILSKKAIISFDSRLFLPAILILATKVILFVFFAYYNENAFYTPDSRSYILRALDINNYATFSLRGEPDIFRTPGYPLLLVPFIKLFGIEKVYYVILLQLFLTTIAAYLAYKIVLLMFETDARNKIARIAFIIIMIEPSVLISELSVMTESLFTFTIILGVYHILKYIKLNRWSDIILGFIILGIAAYIRPIGVYFIYLLSFLLFIRAGKRRYFMGIAMVLIAFLLSHFVIDFWKERNEKVFGVRIMSSSAAANAYHYFAAAVTAKAELKNYKDIQKEYEEDVISNNPALQAKYNMKKGMEIIFRHPAISLSIGLKGLIVNMFEPGTGMFANSLNLRSKDSNIIYKFNDMELIDFSIYLLKEEIYLLLFVIIGVVWLFFFWIMFLKGTRTIRFDEAEWILMTTLLYFLILSASAGPGVTFRYRVPVVPIMAVFAAVGISQLKFSKKVF